MTSIGDEAFYHSAYYYDESNWKNGVLYIGNHLIEAKDNVSGKYTIKDGTVAIASTAFYGCTALIGVTIPASVTYIDTYAFSDCSSLASVVIPNSVTSIGEHTFSNCSSLANVVIPENLTEISHTSFSDCPALIDITVAEKNISFKMIDGILCNESGISIDTHKINGLAIDSEEFKELYIDEETGAILSNTPGARHFANEIPICDTVMNGYITYECCGYLDHIEIYILHNPDENGKCWRCGENVTVE